MWKEFRAFILRGNIMDMAVGVIVGAAFSKIVSSFVSDVLMPPIGMLLGKVDFSNLFVVLDGRAFETLAEAKKAGAPTLTYGVFINALIDFLIVATTIFLVLRAMSRLQKKEAAPAAVVTTKDCPFCISAIPLKATKCAHCGSEVPVTA